MHLAGVTTIPGFKEVKGNQNQEVGVFHHALESGCFISWTMAENVKQ